MNQRLILVPLLTALFGVAALSAAEAGHDEHDGHDHGPAPAATAPAKKKPHVHGAHGEEEGEEEHAPGGHKEGADEVALPAAVAASFGIVARPIESRALAAMVMAPGWVIYDPAGQAHLSTAAAGRVLSVRAQVGDTVAAGDALVEILSPAFVEAQSSFLLKRGAAIAAQYQLDSTSESLERGRKAGDGISGAELKRRETDARLAKVAKLLADAEQTAALSAVRLLGPDQAMLSALTGQGTVVDTLVLRAPIAGTVIERTAIAGQQVASDGVALLTIADTRQLWVVANIPEARMAAVTVGSLAEIYAFDGTRIGDGDVASVTPDIDPHTRTGRARMAIAGSATIRPGMYVQVRITPLAAETGAKVVAVPEGAVMTLEGRSVVFIAAAEGEEIHFSARPVMVGTAVAGYAPILSGLKAGEMVVVEGAFLLKADIGKEGAEHEH